MRRGRKTRLVEGTGLPRFESYNGPRLTSEGLWSTPMNDSGVARARPLRSGQTDPLFVRPVRLLCRRLLRSFTLSFNLCPEKPAYVRGL